MTADEKGIDRFSLAEGSNQGSRQVVDKFWQARIIWTKSIPLFSEKTTPDLKLEGALSSQKFRKGFKNRTISSVSPKKQIKNRRKKQIKEREKRKIQRN